MSQNPIAETVASLMPRAKAELTELVAFQSVADWAQFPKSESEGAANWVADALRAEGFQDVALLDTPDGTQSVYGFLPGPEGAPTVLLYAHYDVQPPLDDAAWISPAFELTERDGRWYGRGAADCKGGFIMHLLALRALKANGGVPVFREGDRGGLGGAGHRRPPAVRRGPPRAADRRHDRDRRRGQLPPGPADGDGHPARHDADQGQDRHPGREPALRMFGGVAPDALAALIRLLDSLRSEDGSTTVDGLASDAVWEGLQYPEADFRADAKVLDGVELIGEGTIADRLWARPAVTVLGIDCPPVVGATPSVHASAGALISLRVPPGVDTAEAIKLLEAHLIAHTPWKAKLELEVVGQGQPFQADTSSPAYASMAAALREAYDGQEMQISGMGGSIPLCNTLTSLYPRAEMLLIGLSEPEAQIHAVNESVSPQELERLSVAEALFLVNYAESKRA